MYGSSSISTMFHIANSMIKDVIGSDVLVARKQQRDIKEKNLKHIRNIEMRI